jgi:hypothetical protein
MHQTTKARGTAAFGRRDNGKGKLMCHQHCRPVEVAFTDKAFRFLSGLGDQPQELPTLAELGAEVDGETATVVLESNGASLEITVTALNDRQLSEVVSITRADFFSTPTETDMPQPIDLVSLARESDSADDFVHSILATVQRGIENGFYDSRSTCVDIPATALAFTVLRDHPTSMPDPWLYCIDDAGCGYEESLSARTTSVALKFLSTGPAYGRPTLCRFNLEDDEVDLWKAYQETFVNLSVSAGSLRAGRQRCSLSDVFSPIGDVKHLKAGADHKLSSKPFPPHCAAVQALEGNTDYCLTGHAYRI